MTSTFETAVRHNAQQVHECWTSFINAHLTTLKQKKALEQKLAAVAGRTGEYVLSSWDVEANLCDIYSRHFKLIVEHFTLLLCAEGPAPDIDIKDFINWEEPTSRQDVDGFDTTKDSHLMLAEHAATLDLRIATEHLLTRLSPERAQAQALEQAAARIQIDFEDGPYSRRIVPIEERGGRKVMSVRRYFNDYSPWTMTRGDRAKLHRMVEDLRTLLRSADNHDIHCTDALRGLVELGQFSSREKFDAGPGLDIVTFKEKIEFRFQPRTLDALQIAMSSHANH